MVSCPSQKTTANPGSVRRAFLGFPLSARRAAWRTLQLLALERSFIATWAFRLEIGRLVPACFLRRGEGVSAWRARWGRSTRSRPRGRSSSIRGTDSRRASEIYQRQPFTPVYKCWRVSAGVPNSLIMRIFFFEPDASHMSFWNQKIGPMNEADLAINRA